MKRILSVDGGGVRGIIPAAMLCELGLQLHDFDLLAGTSSGAITVGLLAAGYSPISVVQFYREEAPKIFGGRRCGIFRSRYPAAALDACLSKFLGQVWLSRLGVPVVLPAYDLQEGRPTVFTRARDVCLADAVRASVAAPTYFPPAQDRYIDGGVWANNPALVAVAEAKALWPGEPLEVLSLGTGAPQQHLMTLRNAGLLGWGPKIIDTLLTASADATDAVFALAAGSLESPNTAVPKYVRRQVLLPEAIGLDDVSALGRLEQLARENVRQTCGD